MSYRIHIRTFILRLCFGQSYDEYLERQYRFCTSSDRLDAEVRFLSELLFLSGSWDSAIDSESTGFTRRLISSDGIPLGFSCSMSSCQSQHICRGPCNSSMGCGCALSHLNVINVVSAWHMIAYRMSSTQWSEYCLSSAKQGIHKISVVTYSPACNIQCSTSYAVTPGW